MTGLDAAIQEARAAVLASDHAYQLAWGAGDPRRIQEAEAAYNVAFDRLGRLVKRRLEARHD